MTKEGKVVELEGERVVVTKEGMEAVVKRINS